MDRLKTDAELEGQLAGDAVEQPKRQWVYGKRGPPDAATRKKLSEAMKAFNRKTGKPSLIGQALARGRREAKKGK